MLPGAFLSGLLFQNVCARDSGVRFYLAKAYGWEFFGSFWGCMLSTYGFRWGWSNLQLALFGAGACWIAAGYLYCRGKKTVPTIFVSLVVLALPFSWSRSRELDRLLQVTSYPGLKDSQDTPYGRVVLTEKEGQITLFENGQMIFDSQDTSVEEFVHSALLAHREPRRLLLFSGILQGMVPPALSHTPDYLDCVELSREEIAILLEHSPVELRRIVQHPKIGIHYGDPRRYAANHTQYDVILSGMTDPSTGYANRLYTVEFFRQCRSLLTESGILALRISSSENYWTAVRQKQYDSLFQALHGVFNDVLLLPGNTNVILASPKALDRKAEVWLGRWQDRGIRSDSVSPAYFPYVLENERFYRSEQLLQDRKELPNTDDQPMCFRYHMLTWLSRFLPSLISWKFDSQDVAGTIQGGLLVACAICGLILWIGSGNRNTIPAWGAFYAGFLGMVGESVLLLYYQVKYGILYQNIGVLMMTFMLGAALGGLAAHAFRFSFNPSPHRQRMLLFLILGGLILGLLGIRFWLLREETVGEFVAFAMMAMTGMLTSVLFSVCAQMREWEIPHGNSWLFALDYLGGATGAILSGLLFLPWLGLSSTVTVLAILTVIFLLPVGRGLFLRGEKE
jgi:spermidine synthase